MTEIVDTPAFVAKADFDAVVAERDNLKLANGTQALSITTLNGRIASFKEEIKQFVIDNMNGHVTNDDLTELADAFDISLTQEISFTASVTFNVTATVPLGFDLDDISGYDFTADLSYSGDMEDFNFDYHTVEVEDVEVL